MRMPGVGLVAGVDAESAARSATRRCAPSPAARRRRSAGRGCARSSRAAARLSACGRRRPARPRRARGRGRAASAALTVCSAETTRTPVGRHLRPPAARPSPAGRRARAWPCRRPPRRAGRSRRRASWPSRRTALEVRQVLGLVAERDAQEDDLRALRGLRVLAVPRTLPPGTRSRRLGRRLGRALGVARADDHRRALRAQPQRQAEAQRAGAADDRRPGSATAAQSYSAARRHAIRGTHRARDGRRVGHRRRHRRGGWRPRERGSPSPISTEDGAREVAARSTARPSSWTSLDNDSVAAGVAAATEAVGPLDVLVNNAGGGERALGCVRRHHRPPTGTSSCASTCAACSRSPTPCCRGCRSAGDGAIVNVASEAGRVGSEMNSPLQRGQVRRHRLHQGGGAGVRALRRALQRGRARPDRDAAAGRGREHRRGSASATARA